MAFYLVIKDNIASNQPIYKFISIKFVLFVSFWQATVISILATFGLISGNEYITSDNIQTMISSFLLCVEMVIAAGFHMKAFSAKDYMSEPPFRTNGWEAFKDSIRVEGRMAIL